MVAQQTHIQVKYLHECHMSCKKCHHAQIPSHSPTPSHMHMPSVKIITCITHDPCIKPSPAHQYPMQVPMGNQSQVNPDSYHTTRSLGDKHDRVSLWATELFGSCHESLKTMFQAFHLRGLTVPFLLHPTHIIYISFYVLIREKYELTTHSSTMMMDDPTHAHTPNIM